MNDVIERTYYDVDLNPIINQTKMKIIEVSIELFSKKGFSGASIRDITKEVGIKESSLYKHFKNKDQILETIFVNFRIEAEKILPPMEYIDQIVETMDLKMFLAKGIENFVKHIDEEINFNLWRILYSELFRQPTAQEIYRNHVMEKTVDCLEVVFQKMIDKGKMKPIHPRTMAREYHLSTISLILEYNILKDEGKSTVPIEEQINLHLEFFSSIGSPL